MKTQSLNYKRALLFLLCLLSFSVILATILYQYDKEFVIWANAKRSAAGDFIWLNITHSAGLLSYGTVIVAAALSFFKKDRAIKFRCYAIVMAGVISGTMITVIKNVLCRIRPFHLFSHIHPLGPGTGWSYPSGHTGDAFFLAAIIFLIFPRKHLLISVIYCWAFLVAFSRVYLGVHYLSDVIGGMAISSLSAIGAFLFIRYLYQKKDSDQS